MSVRRRPDRGAGVWEVVVDCGREPSGRRRRLTRQVTGTRADAEAVEAALRAPTAPAGRSWPLEPLTQSCSVPLSVLAARAGFDPAACRRWVKSGQLTDDAADRLTTAAGLHPAMIWPGF